MKGSQRIGAYAALIQGILFVVLLIIFVVVLPGNGITSPTQLSDPAKAASVGAILALISLIVLFDGASVVLVTTALFDRMQAGAPTRMRYALTGATVASALFLGNAIAGFVGGRMLAGVTDASVSGPASVAFFAVTQSLLNAAIFAASVGALLWGWAALETKNLPSALSYVVLLAGVVGILSIFVGGPVSLLQFVVNAIWSLWLGYVLLR